MEQSKIDRINFLARKSRESSLTEEEKKEQQKLRAEYVAAFRKNLVSTLESTIVERPDGTRLPLVENNKLNKKLKWFMVNIREVRRDDIDRVKYICIQTADEKAKTDKATGEIIANTYSTYYVREEPGTCFVLEDNGLVVGYIICSTNAKKFRKIFRRIDLKEIKKINKTSAIESWFIPLPYMIFKRIYPAHLHINLLEDYQGKGYGTQLMNELLFKLRGMGVKGVMLLASENNKGAVKFYKKHGFKILVTAFGGVAIGKKL